MYSVQESMMSPLHTMATFGKRMWQCSLFPMAGTPFGRLSAAANEMVERATRNYQKPAFGLEVPEVVVDQTPFCNLVHFAREVPPNTPKLLVVAPMSGHYASLLRDTVARMLPEHDVYVTDWVDARLVPLAEGPFDLDTYALTVMRFLRLLGPEAHVLAVCQPCVPVLAAVSLLSEAERPRSMTLMAGPVDARINPTEVGQYALKHPLDWFERTAVTRVPAGEPGFMRRVYSGQLQLAAFIGMNPGRHAEAHRQFFRDLVGGNTAGAEQHRRFYDNYLAVMDLTAEFYLQTVGRVFQTFDLARGAMTVGGEPVRPETIRRTALMTVEGEKDDICGLGQTAAAQTLCSSIPAERRREYVQKGVGHYGVFSGRRWREEIAPRIEEFIRAS